MSIFLVTILNCSDIISIANRIQSVVGLTNHQKIDIVNEVKKVAPTCPVIIKSQPKK